MCAKRTTQWSVQPQEKPKTMRQRNGDEKKKTTIDFTDEIMALLCVYRVCGVRHTLTLVMSTVGKQHRIDDVLYEYMGAICTRTFFPYIERWFTFGLYHLLLQYYYTSIMFCFKIHAKRIQSMYRIRFFHKLSFQFITYDMTHCGRNILFWWSTIHRIASLPRTKKKQQHWMDQMRPIIIIISQKVEQCSRMPALQFWHAKNRFNHYCLFLNIDN